MRKSYNLYQRILSFFLSLMMAFTSIPVTAVAEVGDETISVENTGYYLHIDQQHGFGTILDTNEEKEYSSNYNDDMSKLLTKSAEYEAGEDVELKIDVNEGLRLTDIIVKTDSGDEVDYDYDGKCVTFAMPEDDVNVSITAENDDEYGVDTQLSTELAEEIPTQTLTIEKYHGELYCDGMYDVASIYGSVGENFTFELTLSNGNYFNGTHTINGVEFIDGVGTFTLNGGDPAYSSNAKRSITFELPVNTQFQVKELGMEGYKPSFNITGIEAKNAADGEGMGTDLSTDTEILTEGSNAVVQFTNIYISESYYDDMANPQVTITKDVIGNDDSNEEFEVTLYLSRIESCFNGNYYAGTHIINGVEFVDGVGTFTLKNGESKTFDVISNTFFRVDEKEYSSYETSYAVSQPWNTFSLSNEEESVNPNSRAGLYGSYTVRKIDSYGRPLEGAVFEVVRSSDNKVTDTWSNSYHYGTMGNSSLFTMTEVSAPEGYERDTTVHSMRLYNYSDNIYDFTIVNFKENEIDLNNWGISYGGNNTVTITNKAKPNLTVSKVVNEKQEDGSYLNYDPLDATYKFAVNFSNMKVGDSFTSDIGDIVADENGNATATFYLKNNESVNFYNLPIETQYIVTEPKYSRSSDYSTYYHKYTPSYFVTGLNVVQESNSGKSYEDLPTELETLELGENGTVIFTNEISVNNPATLTVTKNVEGIETDEEFEVTVILNHPEVPNYYKGVTRVLDGVNFEDGVGTFTLKNGESKNFVVPIETNYVIEEKEYPNYKVEYSKNSYREEYGATTYAFESTVSVGVIKIDTKGNFLDGANLQLIDPQGNIYEEWDTAKNNFDISLGDETALGTWKIREVSAPDGYEKLDKDIEFTIDSSGDVPRVIFVVNQKIDEPKRNLIVGQLLDIDDSQTVVITNTYNVGKLVVKKKVVGNDDSTEAFEFTITLKGDKINGVQVFNGETFTNGVATIHLKAGDSKEFDLPAGTKYTVKELEHRNYATEYSVEVIDADPSNYSNTEILTDKKTVVTITNTYTAVDITLKKVVSNIETIEKFTINAEFKNLEPMTTYKLSNGSTMTALADGTASYTAQIGHNEEVVFYDIPVDTQYKFTEVAGNYKASYKIIDNNKS